MDLKCPKVACQCQKVLDRVRVDRVGHLHPKHCNRLAVGRIRMSKAFLKEPRMIKSAAMELLQIGVCALEQFSPLQQEQYKKGSECTSKGGVENR